MRRSCCPKEMAVGNTALLSAVVFRAAVLAAALLAFAALTPSALGTAPAPACIPNAGRMAAETICTGAFDVIPGAAKNSAKEKSGGNQAGVSPSTADKTSPFRKWKRRSSGEKSNSGIGVRRRQSSASAYPESDGNLRILSFTKYHPRSVRIWDSDVESSCGTDDDNTVAPGLRISALGDVLSVNGNLWKSGELLALPRGTRRISFGEGAAEKLNLADTALEISAKSGELRIVLVMDLESYVARTLASETEANTPLAALEAQAVVARTYALFADHRHEEDRADLCDLAHCQVFSWKLMEGAHLSACRLAAEKTAGMTLIFPSNSIQNRNSSGRGRTATRDNDAAAKKKNGGNADTLHESGQPDRVIPVFHASCGGTTANPTEIFDGKNLTGAAPVADPECASDSWTASVSSSVIRRVLSQGLCGLPLAMEDGDAFSGVSLRRSGGGRVVQLQAGGCFLSGEAFVRRLGAAVGYGKVPSAIFWARRSSIPGQTILTGRGKGHGVGLCQAGAARLARSGADFRAILQRYFPRAILSEKEAAPGRRPGNGRLR